MSLIDLFYEKWQKNNALCCFFDTLVPLRYLPEEG